MRILISGFEPFGGYPLNPSMEVVNALPRSERLIARVLPVVYDEAAHIIRQLIHTERPDAVLCLGLCARSASIVLERVAINLSDDLAGDRTKDRLVDPQGPVGYWSTLPLTAMHYALREKGIPVAWSNHAGTYVCNHVFYTARRAIEQRNSEVPCGFVHLPPLGEGGLPLPALVDAVETLVDVIELNLQTK